MSVLDKVPEGLRDEVEELMAQDALDFQDKYGILKDIIDDPVLIMQILDNMGKATKKKTKDTPSSDDFLSLVTEQKMKLMKRLIDKENWETLEKLVAREDEDVQTAYDNWREYETTRQIKKEPLVEAPKSRAKPPQPTPTPPRNRADTSTYSVRSTPSSSVRNAPTTKRRVQPPPEPESDSDQDSYAPSLSSRVSKMDLSDTEEDEQEVEEEEDDQNGAPQIDDNFFDGFPDCLNILILGETGVGKSTFINGLVNYLKYGSIDEAHKNDVEILIEAYFVHTDADYNRMDIRCMPTIQMESSGEVPNESTVYGQSSTQAPKSYVFSWGPRGSQKQIRIIDTPGVGDVRGVNQEKLNFAKILDFIADFSEIHAICILLKPNESKLNLTFRYCINELLTHLHVSASKNILFCFTNARQTLYRPGDTLPTLDAHLKELNQKRGINIPLNSDTMFCFDNESFRFLCALREGAKFEQKDIDNFNGSWKKTVDETFRLFKRISQLPVHHVSETLSVNNIRAVILALARPLAEIARNQLVNVKLIEDKIREVDDCMKNGKDLEGRLYVNQVKIFAKEIDYPMTVCTAKSCVKHQRFTSDPNAPMETVYKTECHNHCYLQGVQVSLCPNPALQKCWALNGNIDKCRTCKCPWNTHMHIRYQLEKSMEKTMDPTVKESIRNRDDQVQTAKLFVEKETKRKEELKAEADRIAQYCVEFAAFLRKNSILPYNDVYKEYVEHLIKEEKDKISQGGPKQLLKQLEEHRDEYEQQIQMLESHGTKSKSTKTIQQIYNMVEDLKKMKNCGSMLKDIQNLEMMSVREQQITKVTPVDLSTGWLGQAYSGGGRGSGIGSMMKKSWNYMTGKKNTSDYHDSKAKKGGKKKY